MACATFDSEFIKPLNFPFRHAYFKTNEILNTRVIQNTADIVVYFTVGCTTASHNLHSKRGPRILLSCEKEGMHFSSSKLPFQIYWGSFIVCKKAKKNVVKTILKSHLIKN